jgi:hypothetical protein
VVLELPWGVCVVWLLEQMRECESIRESLVIKTKINVCVVYIFEKMWGVCVLGQQRGECV